MTHRILVMSAALLAGSAALADDYVDRADANGDGYVSLYELRAAYYADPAFNERIEASFAALDRNGDGRISADERGSGRAAPDPRAPVVMTPDAVRLDPSRDLATPPREPARSTPAAAPADRFEAWIADIDVDNSGSASAAELLGGGGGAPWFSKAEFEAADRNDDQQLDAAELGQLVSSLERRRR